MMCKDECVVVSIIVPVYNTDRWLNSCLDSVLAQTYAYWECILVDDGSRDNSGIICDEYVKRDKRFHVVHQVNSGVTFARKTGVLYSSGEWIMFVDSDDTLPVDALELFLSVNLREVDIVSGSYEEKTGQSKFLKQEDYIKHLLVHEDIVPAALWGKMFRRSLFSDTVFDIPREIVLGEDLIVNIRLALVSQNVKLLHKLVYNYRTDNINSASHVFESTLEYEQLFFHYLENSFSTSTYEKYIEYIILYKIMCISSVIGYSYRLCADERMIINAIRAIIRRNKIRIPFQYKIQLSPNVFCRFCGFNILKIRNVLKRYY